MSPETTGGGASDSSRTWKSNYSRASNPVHTTDHKTAISSEQPDQLNNSTVQIAEKCANRQYSCRSKSEIAPTICKGGYKNSNDYKSRYKLPSSMMHSYIANKVQDLNAYQFSITKLDSASRHLPAIRLIGGYPASRKPTLRTHYQLDKTRKTETSSREPFTVRSATKVTSD